MQWSISRTRAFILSFVSRLCWSLPSIEFANFNELHFSAQSSISVSNCCCLPFIAVSSSSNCALAFFNFSCLLSNWLILSSRESTISERLLIKIRVQYFSHKVSIPSLISKQFSIIFCNIEQQYNICRLSPF